MLFILDAACAQRDVFVGASLSLLPSPWRSFQLNYKKEERPPALFGGLQLWQKLRLVARLFSCV